MDDSSDLAAEGQTGKDRTDSTETSSLQLQSGAVTPGVDGRGRGPGQTMRHCTMFGAGLLTVSMGVVSSPQAKNSRKITTTA